MDGLIIAAFLALAAWLSYRLLRWARSRAPGAHVLGAVLTAVTQSAVVREAKQGKKPDDSDAGDPPDEE